MMKHKKLSMAVAGACALMASSASYAGVTWKAGEWDVDIGGNINAFYTSSSCDSASASTVVTLGTACAAGGSVSNIRNGLLPGALVTTAKTRQKNFDIGATVGIYPGINSDVRGSVNSGVPGSSAFGSGTADFRQVFLTFGDKSWGTIKMGRDLALFGSNAILSDMTLLGVGGGMAANNPTQSVQPPNTSLGRIGLGYIYADFRPQITYTFPSMNGFQFSVGAMQGLNVLGGPAYNQHDRPALQGLASYEWKGAVAGKAWLGVTNERAKANAADQAANGVGVSNSFTGTAWELGGKFSTASFEGVASWYTGKGIGTTGILVAPVDAFGNKRDSDGYYLQGAVKFGDTKVGLSYGESKLKLTGSEVATGNTLVSKNKATILGLYHNLTKSLTLVGEYADVRSDAHGGNHAKETGFTLGAILFF